MSVCVCVCVFVHESECVFKCFGNCEYVWLRNYLELYGMVEAVIRNSLLR